MIRQLLRKLSASIFGGAFIIAVASVLSRCMGLVRDNIFANYFGASAQLDVYTAAFKVPDFLFNIIVLGALSASFIPAFIQAREQGSAKEAWRLASTVINYLLAALFVCVSVGIIAAPAIAHWLMAERPLDQQLQTAQLMRVMLVSIIFFGVSNVFSGILHSYRRFLMYSLAPILYNVGIIFGLVVLYPRFQLLGLAYGVLLGAALHCAVQLPAVVRLGYHYVWSWQRTPGVEKILKQMPARALALGVVQVNALIITAYALRLEEGSLTMWSWADNLQNVPINVFGVSLALSAFPVFSQAFAENDVIKFKNIFSQNFRRLLFVIIPISATILLLRAQFVRLLLGSFGHGQFDWAATITTSQVLGIFSVVMFAQATIPMLVRSFFAHHDTKTTVVVSIISVILNAALAWGLSDDFGIFGLASAFAVSSLFQMLTLLLILRLKFGDLEDAAITRSIWRIILATLALGLVIQGMKYFIAPLVDMRTVFGLFIQTSLSAGAGLFVYGFVALVARFPEVDIIRGYLRKLKAAL